MQIPHKNILDFGSGNYNYRSIFKESKIYHTCDQYYPADYKTLEEIKNQYDLILAIEVLEHVANPKAIIQDLYLKLNEGGKIIISTPFNARVHRCPKDFFRYSIDFFLGLKEENNFNKIIIKPRGDNLDTLLNKMLYLHISCLKGIIPFLSSLILTPMTLILLIAHYILPEIKSIQDDPLGFIVIIEK